MEVHGGAWLFDALHTREASVDTVTSQQKAQWVPTITFIRNETRNRTYYATEKEIKNVQPELGR
jgi:hypothetical protein